MEIHPRFRPFSAWILIGLLAFLGINAVVAGGLFIIAPDGHLIQMPLSNLDGSPFSNFLIPGVLLFLFVGVYSLVIAGGLWKLLPWQWPNRINPFKRFHWSWAGSLAAGLILIIWILVQIQWVQFGMLHIICLAWGTLILMVGLLPGVRRYCTL